MIPRLWLSNFTQAINGLSASSRSALEDVLATIDLAGDVADVRSQVVAAMQGVCGASASAAAQLAAAFYNAVRQYELGEVIRPTYDSGRDPAATEGAVRAFADKLVKGNPEAFKQLCIGRVDYEIKVAAAQTCLNNARIDPNRPRFARVPTGDETCDFCLMLASRGFVYHTEVTASHAHEHCDCRIVPSWRSHEVEGYDPSALYTLWQESIESKAAKRAAKNKTDIDTERDAIMESYAKSSRNAKERRKLR